MTRCPYCSALTLRDPHTRPGTDDVCRAPPFNHNYYGTMLETRVKERERVISVLPHAVAPGDHGNEAFTSVMDLEESRAAPVETDMETAQRIADFVSSRFVSIPDPPADAPATLPDEVKP